MKNLNQTQKGSLKLNKETVSKLSSPADGINFPTDTFPTTSRLCFGLARLGERN